MAINKATSGAIYWRSTSATMTNEATTSSAGNVYQVTDSAKRILDPAVYPTLNTTARTYLDTTYKDNGWDFFNGQVKLTGATSPTVTGAYLVLTSLVDVVSWSLTMNKNAAETTAIGDTWKEYTAVESGATLSINRYYSDTEGWQRILASDQVIVKIWEDGTSGFWCKGIMTGFNPSFAVGQVDNEAITIAISSVVGRF